MTNALMVALFMFMALLIGNKIGHDAASAGACKVTHDEMTSRSLKGGRT